MLKPKEDGKPPKGWLFLWAVGGRRYNLVITEMQGVRTSRRPRRHYKSDCNRFLRPIFVCFAQT